jgi:hypothetical protein
MIIEAPSVNFTIPVVPGDYTTVPLDFGTVNFTNPEPFTSTVIDEIILQFEHPNSGKPGPDVISTSGSSPFKNETLYLPPSFDFFRRFDQWFVTVLLEGTGFPFTPFYIYISHFDRPNRKVYYTRGTLTLSRVI